MAGGQNYNYYENGQQQQQQHYGQLRQYEEGASPPAPLPVHLCFFLSILFVFLTLSWYLSYESALESLVDQLKLVVVLSPLVLLLAVHWLSSAEPGQRLPLLLPLPERDSLHRAGGSPWGVGLVLLLLVVMVSYQSYFHDRWFPLRSR